jgi:glycosyltransferase involved in cell wall biosynthesis
MTMDYIAEPLVTVLTPVYNGEQFLEKCIDSVLNQTYQNFEYIIVNNCSTDRSLEIANTYAKRDKRMRVHTNDRFVDVIENHNIAFQMISKDAKYCKIVSADDLIFPNCLRRLVQCAEANPSVGLVGCYQLSGSYIRWQGFEYPKPTFDGATVCRKVFIEREYGFGFGSPTSLLYRADLVRATNAYYPNPSPHSDTSACFRDLVNSDFGFVYEVLCYEKTHAATQSAKSMTLNRYLSADLHNLIEYGPSYLSERELQSAINKQLSAYYRFLAINLLIGSRKEEFWNYHRGRLMELGYPLKRRTLYWTAARTILHEFLNPDVALRKVYRHLLWKSEVSGDTSHGIQSGPTSYRTASL